jgi:hypothetical protein
MNKPTARSFAVLLLAACVWGCAAPYELTHESDLPQLKGSLADALHGEFSDREKILSQALKPFGLELKDGDDDLLECPSKQHASKQHACYPLEDKGHPLPPAIIAVVYAAVGECRHEVYDQDTTAVSQATLGTFLGIGLLVGGIVNGIVHGPSAISTVTAVGGAGVTAASNVKSGAPPAVQASTKNMIEAVDSYYPLLTSKIAILKAKGHPVLTKGQKVEMLSAVWDTAGTGCPSGVLKGRSWFNKAHDRDEEQ